MRKHYKSGFLAVNVSSLSEVIATNTNFSDTPGLDVDLLGHGGTKMVQLFCGCQSLITAVYPIQKEGNSSGTLVLEGRNHLGYYWFIIPVIKG
jgi:hypothetical protein